MTTHVFVVTLETQGPVPDLIDLLATRSFAIPGVTAATAAVLTQPLHPDVSPT